MKNKKKKTNKNLVLLLLGRGVSDVGASIQMIVMPLFILDIGGSAATVGLFSFLSVATVFVYPFAGVLGDRWNRKTIMVSTDFASACVVLLLFACSHMGLISLPILLVAQVCIAILNGLFDPATKGIVPQIVEQVQLTKVNAIVSSLRTISVLLGSVIGSMLYANLGITVLLLLNGISFFLSGCSEMFISYRHVKGDHDGKVSGLLADLVDGVQFIYRNKTIGKLCVYFLFTYALIQPIFNVVLPVFFRGSLSYPDTQYGYLQMFFIAGALLGSVLVGVLFGKKQQIKVSLSIGCTCMVIILSLLAVLMFPFSIRLFGNDTPAYFLMLSGLLCLLSTALVLIHIPVQTYIQTATPNEYMSRMFSIVGMITKGGMPLGALLYGVALEKVAVHWTLLFAALLTVVISGVFLLSLSKIELKGK